jgi:predicted dehydrogenase
VVHGTWCECAGGPEFAEFQKESEDNEGIQFFKSVADLPAVAEGKKRLALISGRTADNPRLLGECTANGCTTIYLEKPGAPTVAELSAMKDEAKAAGVTVLMGYNKNVCKYVSKARDYASANDGSHVTFVSNNAYENTPESLGECFERNKEGMLKNMAIHELALLVSFYGVSVETIDKCVADKEFSSCQTLNGITDFDKIKFTITTKSGNSVSVQADRCGGDVSYAAVADASGNEVFRHSMPDDDDIANVSVLQKEYPGAMPYFFSQDPDYITVKESVASFCANGTEATGIATIDIAVETLRVAEYLTPTLQKQLS